MKILPDYEHMEYRDVYTCRTYLTACTVTAAVVAWVIACGLASQPWEMLSPCLFFFTLLQLWWAVLSGSLGSVWGGFPQ